MKTIAILIAAALLVACAHEPDYCTSSGYAQAGTVVVKRCQTWEFKPSRAQTIAFERAKGSK